MAELLEAVRFVHFAAAMAAFGIGAFRLYAFAGDPAPAQAPARMALDRTLARTMTASATVALISALAMVPCVAAEMAAMSSAALDPLILRVVLFATEFGHVWCWHVGFAIALLALCAIPLGRWHAATTTTAALLTLVSLGWVGHATMDMGGVAVHEVNQMVHLIAAGIWLGGLVPLGILLRRATRPEGDQYIPLARTALPHFSQMGYAAVALVALTGLVNGVFLVGSAKALTATPYGRLLIVKIVLFTAMVGLAMVNRFRLMPSLRRAETVTVPLRALFRSVVAEQALALAILAVVAVLGTWEPAIHMAVKMQ
ncbi:MAG TPA: copper homeostasis membrane protein CopD [Stellaceae bacterium]|nr:copper homeostasis membrane protein CopD [Stellaceae bacterium]